MSMRILRFPIWLLTLLTAFAATGASAQGVSIAAALKAAVIRADEARVYAMMAPDIGALDDMLTPDCLYVHSTGVVQTKGEFLAALKTGAMRYVSLRYTALPQIRLYGSETAVLTGTMLAEIALPDGSTVKPTLAITAVYVVQGGRWQLASYHSVNAPRAK